MTDAGGSAFKKGNLEAPEPSEGRSERGNPPSINVNPFHHKKTDGCLYLFEVKLSLQQGKECERRYITASMTGGQDAERIL